MQTFTVISISNGKSAMAMPLAVIVCLSMIKDAYEDYKRHKSDAKENDALTKVLRDQSQSFRDIKWKELISGDIIRVECDQPIPADILILQSSDQKGNCYVETKNLDGETNLKLKYTEKQLQAQFKQIECLKDIQGKIECELPNNQIYKFEGNLQLGYQNKISLNIDYVALRGSTLRNTDYIYGAVLFAGKDTKVMMNSAKAKYKFSQLEKSTNFSILIILALQMILALIAAVTGLAYQNTSVQTLMPNNQNNQQNQTDQIKLVLQLLGTWILLLTNFVPISLMVTLELVKFWQAMFMSQDYLMYDQEQDMPMLAQSSNLNEQLGQVEYVFSDKTGTLTCNIMQFKKFTAGLWNYGTNDTASVHEKQESNVCFYDPNLQMVLNNYNNRQFESLNKVLLFLACCHTVILDEKKGQYNAASPDELALVNAGKQFGYEFKGQDSDNNILIHEKRTGKLLKYQFYHVCEFDSTRKRMSVIVRDPNNKLILMCKGADSVIIERMSLKSRQSDVFQETQKYVDQYAEEGLRTLFLAQRYIGENEFNEFMAEVEQAKLAIENRDQILAQVNEKIEKDLELIGSTAIEDRLQDKVSDCIKFMKQAGIKVWVLTGDKIETAINIGFSAGLLDSNMTQYMIDEINKDRLSNQIDKIYENIKKQFVNQKQAIIVAGASLSIIDRIDDIRVKFLNCSDSVDVVLACRVSPQQKADIVNMIKRRFPKKVTLAIGDGANDVNMILQAHVGVGILGKEGQQAARTADFAIGQFKFLKPLMFIHGREANRRNSFLVLYTFYKNVLYITAQYIFAFWSCFSGQPMYEPFIYQLYNITMTSLPIMFFALFDFEYEKDKEHEHKIINNSVKKDINQLYFMDHPLLFKKSMQNKYFSSGLFVSWLLYALIHAIILYIVAFYSIQYKQTKQADGKDLDFWLAGHLVYGCCIFMANVVILHKLNNYTGWAEVLVGVMIMAFFTILYLESFFSFFPQVYYLFDTMFVQPMVWLIILLIFGISSIMEFTINRVLEHNSYDDNLHFTNLDNSQLGIDTNEQSKLIQKQQDSSRQFHNHNLNN